MSSLTAKDANSRIMVIIDLKKRRYTLPEIAAQLGLKSRERVRQIIVREIIPTYGKDIFKLGPEDTQLFSVEEVAKRLGVTRYAVLNALKRREAPAFLRAERFFLSETGISELGTYFEKRKSCKCIICGKEFKPKQPKRGRRPKTCYERECRKRYKKRHDAQRAIKKMQLEMEVLLQ